jgi:hypothetical protein
MEPWLAMVDVAQRVTGRRVVGTSGGLYAFTEAEIRLPYGSVEGLIHDVCHWVVADESERRQDNMGLSQDWTHPRYDRMVKCEELAWSLETYLFGDPPPEVMASLMTPESLASGGGNYSTSYMDRLPTMTLKRSADAAAFRVTEAALAEMTRARASVVGHGELRPDGNEKLRREACRKAEETGFPVREIQNIVRAWWLATYPARPAEDDSLTSCWDDIKKK